MHISSEDLRYYAECRERRVNAKTRKREALRDAFAQSISDGELTLGIPSGKSLQEQVLERLKRAGIMAEGKTSRQILVPVKGMPFLDWLAFCKPSEMPFLISSGAIPFGLTGSDTIGEFDDADQDTEERNTTLEVCAEFPISKSTSSKTRGVLFVREEDAIADMESLVSLVGHERPIEVVTEYPNATIGFLWKYGIRANLICVRGGAEAVVLLGQRRFGVCLTETGTTLRENGLRIIGELFTSGTALVANKAFLDLPAGREIVRKLVERLGTVA